jgi:hypothetical protein
MNSLATFAVRRAASRTFAQQVSPLSTSIPVEVDHYTSSGWKTENLGEVTKSGKYQIQTFNKISEKVRSTCRYFTLYHTVPYLHKLQARGT